MILLGVQIFGFEIDTALFVFECGCIGLFSWWLIGMYMNVSYLKKGAKKRDKKMDMAIAKLDCVVDTLGTDNIEFGKKFRTEFKNNYLMALEKYKAENGQELEIEKN